MPNRDEFDDPEGFFSRLITIKDPSRPRFFENKSLMFSGVVFIAVVALSGVIWASYPSQNPLAPDGTVPIIRADTTPYKTEPEDRGGMMIANKDSTIFDALRAGEPSAKVEDLLDEPLEKPIDRAQLFAGLKTDLATPPPAESAKTSTDKPITVARMGDLTQDRPLTEAERRAAAAERNKELLEEPAQPLPGDNAPPIPTTGQTDILDTDEVKPIEPAVATPAPTRKGFQEPPVVTQKPVEPTPTSPTPALTTVAVKTGVGHAYVQVASVPNEKQVKSEWGVVSGKLPMIKGLPYRVQKVDLGAKGVFHRIQVGPMSGEDAGQLCAAIKAKKPGGCLVVK